MLVTGKGFIQLKGVHAASKGHLHAYEGISRQWTGAASTSVWLASALYCLQWPTALCVLSSAVCQPMVRHLGPALCAGPLLHTLLCCLEVGLNAGQLICRHLLLDDLQRAGKVEDGTYSQEARDPALALQNASVQAACTQAQANRRCLREALLWFACKPCNAAGVTVRSAMLLLRPPSSPARALLQGVVPPLTTTCPPLAHQQQRTHYMAVAALLASVPCTYCQSKASPPPGHP